MPTDLSAAHEGHSLERRLRTRSAHACGQIIWVIALPQGPLRPEGTRAGMRQDWVLARRF